MKYWKIIADNPGKAGWSWGCVYSVDAEGRTIFVADAHRGDGKRFVARADEKLTAFLELEAATQHQLSAVSHSATHAHSASVLLRAKGRQRKQNDLAACRASPCTEIR